MTGAPSVGSCEDFNTWKIEGSSAENLNEGSSKFITKDNTADSFLQRTQAD